MWKITILGDRRDNADRLHQERFKGGRDAALRRAVELLGQHGGLRADLDPV